MSKKLVVDSNFLVALIDDKDIWHLKAQQIYQQIVQQAIYDFIILDCVVNECLSVVARRLEEKKQTSRLAVVLSKLQQLVNPSQIVWISQDTQKHYPEILRLIVQQGGVLNFNDLLIVLYMREYHLTEILSFDKDFDLLSDLNRITGVEKV